MNAQRLYQCEERLVEIKNGGSNELSMRNTKALINEVGQELDLYPRGIDSSIEGGITLVYRTFDWRCFVEIYNDGTMGYHAHEFYTGSIRTDEVHSNKDIIEELKKFTGV